MFLQEAERIAPENVDVMSTRAAILWSRLRRSDALALFNKVIKISPKHSYSRGQRAQILVGEGKLEQALDDYNVLVILEPRAYIYRMGRAKILMRLGDFSGASADLSAYIQMDRYNRDAFLLRASAYLNLEKTQAALSDFNTVLEGAGDGSTFIIGPDERAEILLRRSFLYLHLGLYDSAAADSLEAISTGGRTKISKLQLFLKRQGYRIEINGKTSNKMRSAITDCFKIGECSTLMFEKI